MSDWVLHFVRDRDPDQDFPGDDDMSEYLAGQSLAPDDSALAVLLNVVKEGALRPGYSMRGERTTIYGGRPAVCFTEMPLYSLALYARDRRRNCSTYAIAVQKTELFGAGGRPVIYGLSGPVPALVKDLPLERILDQAVLPQREQYRYVAFAPDRRPYPMDWTHEREWRWVADDVDAHRFWGDDPYGSYDHLPGLPLFRSKEEGGLFSKVAIIVPTDKDAERIANDLATCRDSGRDDGSRFGPKVLSASFVVVMDRVVDAVERQGVLDAMRLDTLPESTKVRFKPPVVTAHVREKVREAVDQAQRLSKQAVADFLKRHPDDRDVCGFARVVTHLANSEVTQALVAEGLAEAVDGEYVVQADFKGVPVQSLRVHELAAKVAADHLTEVLGQKFWMASRWD